MTATGTTSHSRLADLVGSTNVSIEPEQLASFGIDGMRPAAVLRPESKAHVAEIVKFAGSEKLSVIASAGRTKLNIGLPPRRYDLALDMSGLNKIIAYDPGDLTLSVEAGAPLLQVAKALAQHGQFLPLADPFLRQTTVGAIVASGVDGPLRQFYGTARDFLLGLEFVTGEGVSAKSGGRVVKNVTGYDIHKLMIGALGTLGVITRINFKTFPMPLATRGFIARFANAETALHMRHRIARSPLTPLTVEILSPRVAELFSSDAATRYERAAMPTDVISNTEWALATGYAGDEPVLERYAKDLQRLAQESGATAVAILAENLPPAWARKREVIPIALASSPATTIIKIGVVPMRMHEALATAQKATEANNLRWAAMARGLGIIYFAILPSEHSEDCRQRVASAIAAIQEACAKLAGHATIPWVPAEWKSTLQIWGPPRPDAPQMQKVKSVFDPQKILSPGRFAPNL